MSDEKQTTAMTVGAPGNALAMRRDIFFDAEAMAQVVSVANTLAKSDFVPKDYKDKPGNIIACIQMGCELGVPPMMAMQNIAVINGRPSVWGDLALALAHSHPLVQDVIETISGSFDDGSRNATCKIIREGKEDVERVFTMAMAKKANLWGKQGPWTQYPDRMLQMRARSWAIRDAVPDAMKGMITREEAKDIIELDPTQYEITAEETAASGGTMSPNGLPKMTPGNAAGIDTHDDKLHCGDCGRVVGKTTFKRTDGLCSRCDKIRKKRAEQNALAKAADGSPPAPESTEPPAPTQTGQATIVDGDEAKQLAFRDKWMVMADKQGVTSDDILFHLEESGKFGKIRNWVDIPVSKQQEVGAAILEFLTEPQE